MKSSHVQSYDLYPSASSIPAMLDGVRTGSILASRALESAMIAASEQPVPERRILYMRDFLHTDQGESVQNLQRRIPSLAVEFPMHHDLVFGAVLWQQHQNNLPVNKLLMFITQYHLFSLTMRVDGKCSLRTWGKHIFLPPNTVTVSRLPYPD